MIYYQLKNDYHEHNKGDLFTSAEIELHKTDDTFPAKGHCRVLSTKQTNTIVKGNNQKVKHRRMKNSGNCLHITENGDGYKL